MQEYELDGKWGCIYDAQSREDWEGIYDETAIYDALVRTLQGEGEGIYIRCAPRKECRFMDITVFPNGTCRAFVKEEWDTYHDLARGFGDARDEVDLDRTWDWLVDEGMAPDEPGVEMECTYEGMTDVHELLRHLCALEDRCVDASSALYDSYVEFLEWCVANNE